MTMSMSATGPLINSRANAHSSVGLMKGVSVEANDWYSDDITPSPELTEKGHFYKAASEDASDRNCTAGGYLKELHAKMIQLFRDGPVYDRETLKVIIKEKAAELGSLSFISGSRNIGKTRLLKEIAEAYKDPTSNIMFVYVDGRDGSISQGIKSALNELVKKKWYEGFDFKRLLSMLKSTKNAAKPVTQAYPAVDMAGEMVTCGLENIFDFLRLAENEEAELVELIQQLAEKQGKIPCLVVDEANRVATTEDSALLAKIVNLTKVTQTASVLLCTSVHSYPQKMSDNFNLDHATASYVEELPPSVMWDILTGTQVGMGENLARLAIASCGGNLIRVKKMLEQLKTWQENFVLADYVYTSKMEGCEKVEELMQKGKEEKEIISSLAKKGYWAAAHMPYDKIKNLVESGVASYVEKCDLTPGSPFAQVEGTKILIPSSLALRCYIINAFP